MKRMVNILARMLLLGSVLAMAGCNVITVKPAHHHAMAHLHMPRHMVIVINIIIMN